MSRSAWQVVVDLVMREMLAGDDPIAATLRAQWEVCTTRVDPTGGLIVHFDVPVDVPRLANTDLTAGDVTFMLEGLQHPVGSVLGVREGAIHVLDIHLFGDESWPSEPRVKEILHSLSWTEATARARRAP